MRNIYAKDNDGNEVIVEYTEDEYCKVNSTNGKLQASNKTE